MSEQDKTADVTSAPANRFQEQFGVPRGRAAVKVRNYMTPYVKEFIGHAPFVVTRALKFSQLWNVAQIESHRRTRPISERPFDS